MENLPKAWKVGNFPPISKQVALDLEQAQGKVKLTKDVSISPFETMYVSGNTSFWKHSKR